MHTGTVLTRLGRFLRSCFCWDKPFIKTVMMIALPIMIQQLVTASAHIVDGLMVSGLGDVAYAAVTQAGRFTFLFNLVCFGTSTGSAIFFCQYWGAKDIRKMRHAMGISLFFCAIIGTVFMLLALLFPRQIVSCFLPQGESFELAVKYLRIVAPGYLFFAIDAVFGTMIKAGEKTHYPMISGFVSIGVNTLLNYVLIFGHFGMPAMGVEGAALATAIAYAVSMTMNVSFAYGKKLPAGAKVSEWICPDRAFIKRFVKTVMPVILNEGFWALGVTMYSVFYGHMGDIAVAAVGITTTINDLVWVGIFGLMNATAIIIGKVLGQGEKDKAYLYAKRMIAGSMAFGVFLGVVIILLRGTMVSLFAGLSPEVREMSKTLLMLGGLSIWFRSYNTINVVGVLRSGGDTVFSLILDVGALWLVGVPLTGLAALVLGLPLEWVYVCTFSEEFVKMCIGIPYFKTRKWIHVLTDPKEENAIEQA